MRKGETMPVQLDEDYDRERLALYVTGLLPDDLDESLAVLTVVERLLRVLHDETPDEDQRTD